MSQTTRHAYKELQLRQLRGFCETARLGSLAAAAASLGLSQPTVWEQVRALERALGARLVEAHGRGCRLTPDGSTLVRLLAPLVAGIESLKKNFDQARAQSVDWLTIAATQRVLVEDLPGPLVAFERQHPKIRLRFVELRGDQIAAGIEARAADLGLTTERPTSPWLEFEPVYDLDAILVTPRNHPLARRRTVRPKDLVGYPLVNSAAGGFADRSIAALLEKLGAFQKEPQRVEAIYTAVIRRYVALGFGIGIVPGLPGRPPAAGLHERSMARHFGSAPVHLVWRRGALPADLAHAFAETVRTVLKPKPR